ncbi:hypothetical protein AWT69_002848 [Pseudomonas putida]|nr:hypothetical protein AWT69_002848 [Pseudomonas putida]
MFGWAVGGGLGLGMVRASIGDCRLGQALQRGENGEAIIGGGFCSSTGVRLDSNHQWDRWVAWDRAFGHPSQGFAIVGIDCSIQDCRGRFATLSRHKVLEAVR